MKKLILFLCAVLFVPVIAQAQFAGALSPVPTGVAGGATNATASDAVLLGRKDLCVFIAYTCTNAAANGSVIFEFGRSLDSTNWTRADARTSFTNALAGIYTNQAFIAEINMQGAQYLRFNRVINTDTNGAACGITNILINYFYPRAP